MRVLVVDHETFLAELVKLALEADGHACFTAPTVEEASEILLSIRFDLIALDLAVDDPASLNWLRETTLRHPHLKGRAFVLAGRSLDQNEAARIRECGAEVVQRPFTLHQLRDAVRTMTPGAIEKPDFRPRGSVVET